MRIAVFGASGRTGRELVAQALARNHTVTAHVREPERFDLTGPGLRVVAGDATDPLTVESAVRGQEAVVCALGPGRTSTEDVCSRSTREIVEAMRRHGVRRLVCVTGAMIGHPRDRLVGWVYPLMARLLPRSQRRVLADRRRQEEIVAQSRLDWTLVRPPRLSNERATGNYRHGEGLVLDSFAHVGRADLAHFVLGEVERARYLRRGVAVSY
jgi:putative NADH-flavin reductase